MSSGPIIAVTVKGLREWVRRPWSKRRRPRAARANPNRQVSRRGRAALAWGLAVFAALQIGLAILIETRAPELRSPCYSCKAKALAGRIHASPEPPLTVVMLGSSRTAFGVNGQLVEEELGRRLGRPVVVFNFGMYGAGPVTELVVAKRLFRDGFRPDLMLIEVLPPVLFAKRKIPREINWLPLNELERQDLAVLAEHGWPERLLGENWWQNWPVPWYAQRFNLVSRASVKWLPVGLRQEWHRNLNGSGWVPLIVQDPTPEGKRQATETACQTYSSYFRKSRLNPNCCRAIEGLLAACRAEGIPSALVLMPEAATFRKIYPPQAWEQIWERLSRLCGAGGIPLIDAREWVGDEGFSDSHHLLVAGAAAFTQRLTRDVILPKLKEVIGQP